MSSVPQSEWKESAPSPMLDFRVFFESAPGAFLVVLPDDPMFTIMAVSNGYAQVSGVKREDLLGRGVFEVFPNNPENFVANSVRSLRASFQRALASSSLRPRAERSSSDIGMY